MYIVCKKFIHCAQWQWILLHSVAEAEIVIQTCGMRVWNSVGVPPRSSTSAKFHKWMLLTGATNSPSYFRITLYALGWVQQEASIVLCPVLGVSLVLKAVGHEQWIWDVARAWLPKRNSKGAVFHLWSAIPNFWIELPLAGTP
jgi:hypothetical protein